MTKRDRAIEAAVRSWRPGIGNKSAPTASPIPRWSGPELRAEHGRACATHGIFPGMSVDTPSGRGIVQEQDNFDVRTAFAFGADAPQWALIALDSGAPTWQRLSDLRHIIR